MDSSRCRLKRRDGRWVGGHDGLEEGLIGWVGEDIVVEP